MSHSFGVRRCARTVVFALTILSLFAVLLSACGDPQTQQQASASKANLDALLVHAQAIGVPASLLLPVAQQEAQVSSSNAPLALLSNQPVTQYYSNLSQRYQFLALQVNGLVSQVTQQYDYAAAQELQQFDSALSQREAQNFIEAKTFAAQLAQDQKNLAQAQYPRDYTQIQQSAQRSIEALHLMGPAYNTLQLFQQNISQLKASHVDTTALNQQQQQDLQQFRIASNPDDFTNLINQMNVQLQTTTDLSTLAIPYVGAAKLQQYNADLIKLKQYGMSASSYQQRYNADQQALAQAKSISDYLKISSQIDNDIASLQTALTEGYASYLVQQFHAEVTNWGNAHRYLDAYDGNAYNLDYEYDLQGIGSDADAALQNAQATGQPSDYQAVVDLVNNDLLHLRAMEADYSDKTPYDQPHATDISLMNHYGVNGPNGGQVLVVSLIEQVLRYYDNGKLIRAFNIVSGQYLKPSPPGFWSIILKESPTQFKSSEPPGSAFWYPPTAIQYAMEYHWGGYFFHDAWWRNSFGLYRNFPHADPPGTTTFNDNGSHGCINMAPSDVAWLYPQISWGASVILY